MGNPLLGMVSWATRRMPYRLRPFCRPVYKHAMKMSFVKRIIWGTTSVEKCHEYWRSPVDKDNEPIAYYYDGMDRSKFSLGVIRKYAKPNDRILEIGCNVGRNLNILYKAGFKNLAGIEINAKAVELMREKFPDMARDMEIYNDAVENVIRLMPSRKYDVVFTMAVLEHIHDDSSWIFSEMARITNNILFTIEDEVAASWRTFPRDYQHVFERLGMKQVELNNCDGLQGIEGSFKARVFRHVA